MSIARKKTGKYLSEFPETNNREEIVGFLDNAGIERVEIDYSDPKHTPAVEELREFSKKTGKPCYTVGRYNKDPHTHWVRICANDDTGTVFMIRTDDIGKNPKIKVMFMKETSYVERRNSFREIREEIIECLLK